MPLIAAALAIFASTEVPEPSCTVTYAVDAAREITVSDADCDTPGLEPAARAFALFQVEEGGFRSFLLLQAPVEVEFTFSEAAIRAHAREAGGSI